MGQQRTAQGRCGKGLQTLRKAHATVLGWKGKVGSIVGPNHPGAARRMAEGHAQPGKS